MKKQWILGSATTLLTLFVSLLIVRRMAPELLGFPADLVMVQAAKEVPPFFDGVFREHDFSSTDFILQDPFVKRAKPLYPDVGTMGPNDLLGFRNAAVPNRADVMTIGDSQTYGNNVVLEANWPNQMLARLQAPTTLYSMAVGGWGAVEYLEIFAKALHFEPKVVIVAFYTGNDPLESAVLAHAHERWSSLRPNFKLSSDDMPAVSFPPPESECWKVDFSDGFSTVFTPGLRLASNRRGPASNAGYDIMAEAGRRIGELAGAENVRMIFTIIPTKELVYAKKVDRETLEPPPKFAELASAEAENLQDLARELMSVPGSIYVDLLEPLQQAALGRTALYPSNINGHPLHAGYALIAETLAPAVQLELSKAKTSDASVTQKLFNRAFALQKSGRRDEAVRLYNQVLALEPAHDQAAFNLAVALSRRAPADLDRAISVLMPLVDRRPDYTEVLFRIAEAHRVRGNGKEAAEFYERYLNTNGHPDLTPRARQHLDQLR